VAQFRGCGWSVSFRGDYLGLNSGDGWLWTLFFQWWFLEGVYFGGYVR